MLRVYRIPYSTNVERVSLALAHKRLRVDWIEVEPADRSEVERLTGQPLVPVLVHGERVVTDSTRIVRYLEELRPEPSLWPGDRARAAEADVFVDWFDRVWKRPPNEIEAERERSQPDARRISDLGAELSASLDVFVGLLDGRDYLYGDFGVVDCIAFPFLKYAVDRDPDDDEPFHEILREFLVLGDAHDGVRAWIERVDARPRA